ncbi:MAG: T9SS type A sorting domain-containing protein [Bacteroidetes bacterium]|nr:T9SS type A sorting domain-containing protein [Bacteroidota bacterium]
MKKYYLFIYIICLLVTTKAFPQLVQDFRVNSDVTNFSQSKSRIGSDLLGNFVIVWNDNRRNDSSDVYFQRYSFNGTILGNNTKINSQTIFAYDPEIVVKPNGNFFVIWNEKIGNSYFYRIKHFNKYGDSISTTNNFKDNNLNVIRNYKIAINTNGYLLISWLEVNQNWAYSAIKYQKFDSAGTRIGNNILVTDTTVNKDYNALSVRDDGSFIIAWSESNGSGAINILAQLFSAGGSPIGGRLQVNNNTGAFDSYTNPVVSSDSVGRFCIVFSYYNLGFNSRSVVYQLYNKDGVRKGDNTLYGNQGVERFNPNVKKLRNGNFILSYNNDLNGITYMLRADSSGNFIGNEFAVSSLFPFEEQSFADFVFSNERIITTWTDTRLGNRDIFGNIRSYNKPDSTVAIHNISSEIPSDYKLYQNYPNPFNPETNIMFDVNRSEDIKIIVYDLLGKEKIKLMEGNFTPGRYLIKYNFSAIGSGVYFYKLFIGGTSFETKKLILLK